jgi:hypothetical protein
VVSYLEPIRFRAKPADNITDPEATLVAGYEESKVMLVRRLVKGAGGVVSRRRESAMLYER